MEPFYSDKLELSDSDSTTHVCEYMNFDNYATFDQDLFSACPHEVKLEILSYLTEPMNLCNMSLVCKNWNMATSENRVWKFMFYRDFMWWSGAKSDSVELDEGQSWKDKYSEYYLRGWQWDSSSCNQRIQLGNNNFSASLTTGYTYHGIRTSRGEERGKHYFEIIIEPTLDNTKFDRGATIFMGVGIANEKFNVENCCSGWTRDNCGIGYYNDGQIYALSERHFANSRKTSFKAGDRVGVEFDLENSFVIFYINGIPVTEPIPGVKGKVYPHVILANDIKHSITITTGRKGSSKNIVTTSAPKEQKSIYENQLKVLEEMGFTDREVLTSLLSTHNGDVERLVNELLA